MSSDGTERLRAEILSPEESLRQRVPYLTPAPGHHGLFGTLNGLATRRGWERLRRTVEAQEGAVLAYVRLADARVAWELAKTRMDPNNLAALKRAEEAKVLAERAEQEYRLAEAEAKIEDFDKRREIEKLEHELKLKELKEKLYGKPVEAPPQPEKTVEEKLIDLAKKTAELMKEWEDRKAAPDYSEAEEAAFRARESFLLDEIERLRERGG